jgi:AraC-like DNA-binding protein
MDVFSGVIATMRVGRAEFTCSLRPAGWGNRFGPYPGAGFHVLLHGSCWLVPPEGTPVPLRAGDVVFLPHGSAHGLSDRPDVALADLPPDPANDAASTQPETARAHLVCGAYRLERRLAHPFLQSLPPVVHISPGSRHHDLRSAIDLLGAELLGPRPGSDAALPALMDLVLVYLLRAWLDEQATQDLNRGWPAALTDPLVAPALAAMHGEPDRHWTVPDLARTVGLSTTAFARRFSRVVGRPPLTYLTWWRLNTAARILTDDDAPLAGVARQVGYGSEFAFATAFRREFGVAPGRFRRGQQRHAPDRSRRLVPVAGTRP